MKKNTLQKITLSLYIIFSFVIIALLSPLRILGLYDPGFLRNGLLPFFILLFIFSIGVTNAFRPKTKLQLLIFFVLVQSSIIGIIDYSSLRDYISHLYQLFSAYIMISVGWMYAKNDILTTEFWEKHSNIVLYTTLFTSVLILLLLGQGRVGRLYTPAYNFIFIASLAGFQNSLKFILIVLGLLVSNKRGPTISVILMYLYYYIDNITARFKRPKLSSKKILAVLITVNLAVTFLLSSMIYKLNYTIPSLENAIDITINRMKVIFSGDSDIDTISSGRYSEINAALEYLNWNNFLIGNGAGWGAIVDGVNIHNIHFTPLSLVVVYGLPLAFTMYLVVGYILISHTFTYKSAKINMSVTQKIAPLYILGATIHSFTAYSLFIDLLFFFFIGVSLYTLREKN